MLLWLDINNQLKHIILQKEKEFLKILVINIDKELIEKEMKEQIWLQFGEDNKIEEDNNKMIQILTDLIIFLLHIKKIYILKYIIYTNKKNHKI